MTLFGCQQHMVHDESARANTAFHWWSPSSYSEAESLSTTTFPQEMDTTEPLSVAVFPANVELKNAPRKKENGSTRSDEQAVTLRAGVKGSLGRRGENVQKCLTNILLSRKEGLSMQQSIVGQIYEKKRSEGERRSLMRLIKCRPVLVSSPKTKGAVEGNTQ